MPSTDIDRINGISTSVAVKATCRARTIGNITLSGLNPGSLSPAVTLTGGINERVLVMEQTDKRKNGIYQPTSSGWVRTPDFDGARDAVNGTLVPVALDVNYNSVLFYRLIAPDPVTFESSELDFEPAQIPSSGVMTLANIAALRALSGPLESGIVTLIGYHSSTIFSAPDGGGGEFVYDSTDTISLDNGGTIIVDLAGRRWKRQYSGAPINVRWFGAKGDGVFDDTPAFNNAQDGDGTHIYAPKGIYNVDGIRQKASNLRLTGDGPRVTVLYCGSLTAIALRNFENADNAAPTHDGKLFVENITFRGVYTNPDDYSSSPSTDGRGKSFAASPSIGIRLKRPLTCQIKRCTFEGLHVGIYETAGMVSVIEKCFFDNGQRGYYCENGASWGDPAWKVTTHTMRNNWFSRLWVGAWCNEWVDDCESYQNVFEPCNTGMYVLNGGSFRGQCTVSDYFERCYEGLIFNGGFLSRWRVVDPYFAGDPGNFWGAGKSIHILDGTGSGARIYLDATMIGGGGFLNESAEGKVIANTLRAVGGEYSDNLYLLDRINRPLYPDPMLSRNGRLLDVGAGIASISMSAEPDGTRVINFTGTDEEAIAFNGVRLFLSGKRSGPIRIRYWYKYAGITTVFIPFGVWLGSPYDSFIGGGMVSDTDDEWVLVDVTFNSVDADYALAYAHGGFNGVFSMKELFISEGYGLAENYPINPNIMIDYISPARGSGFIGDRAPNGDPVVGQPKGWICTVDGSPGTWVSEGAL